VNQLTTRKKYLPKQGTPITPPSNLQATILITTSRNFAPFANWWL
jgi:hypothetical protein